MASTLTSALTSAQCATSIATPRLAIARPAARHSRLLVSSLPGRLAAPLLPHMGAKSTAASSPARVVKPTSGRVWAQSGFTEPPQPPPLPPSLTQYALIAEAGEDAPGGRASRGAPAAAVGGAVGETTAAGGGRVAAPIGIRTEVDERGRPRMVLQDGGYEQWQWRGHKVNFVRAGDPSSSETPVLFIHGFGASVYHWRYNLPALAPHRPVFAVDLLGFGWSDRALTDYSAQMWGEQIADFVKEVVGRPAVLVGNSVGGYITLATAANHPEAVAAAVLVNAAGKFQDSPPGTPPLAGADETGSAQARKASEPVPAPHHTHSPSEPAVPLTVAVQEAVGEWVGGLREAAGKAVQRVVLYVTFLQAKQPKRIQQVLELVYFDKSNADDELVRSIVMPTNDTNAAEVYHRLSTQVLLHPSALSLNALLARLHPTPTLLLWGTLDPWMTPAKARDIQDNYPAADRIDINAGHCSHDERPEEFNAALLGWLEKL